MVLAVDFPSLGFFSPFFSPNKQQLIQMKKITKVHFPEKYASQNCLWLSYNWTKLHE
jgi:hypothetical protein